jgi:mycothiol system anti-sigma-R factor
MNCNEAYERRYRYLDQEMTVVRRLRLTFHLRRCPPCADGFAFEQKLRTRIAQGCVDPYPNELHERLVSLIRQTDTDGTEPGGLATGVGPGG